MCDVDCRSCMAQRRFRTMWLLHQGPCPSPLSSGPRGSLSLPPAFTWHLALLRYAMEHLPTDGVFLQHPCPLTVSFHLRCSN